MYMFVWMKNNGSRGQEIKIINPDDVMQDVRGHNNSDPCAYMYVLSSLSFNILYIYYIIFLHTQSLLYYI